MGRVLRLMRTHPVLSPSRGMNASIRTLPLFPLPCGSKTKQKRFPQNKLGAIFGGRGGDKPPPEKVKPAVQEKMSSANEETRANLAKMLGGGGGGGGDGTLKDDPMFAKYFKMLKMHLPPPAVKQKMTAEGLDPAILDMDPEGPSPNAPPASPSGGGGGDGAPKRLSRAAQMSKDLEEKQKASGVGAPMPMSSRPSQVPCDRLVGRSVR